MSHCVNDDSLIGWHAGNESPTESTPIGLSIRADDIGEQTPSLKWVRFPWVRFP